MRRRADVLLGCAAAIAGAWGGMAWRQLSGLESRIEEEQRTARRLQSHKAAAEAAQRELETVARDRRVMERLENAMPPLATVALVASLARPGVTFDEVVVERSEKGGLEFAGQRDAERVRGQFKIRLKGFAMDDETTVGFVRGLSENPMLQAPQMERPQRAPDDPRPERDFVVMVTIPEFLE